jgi:hypothetical protein
MLMNILEARRAGLFTQRSVAQGVTLSNFTGHIHCKMSTKNFNKIHQTACYISLNNTHESVYWCKVARLLQAPSYMGVNVLSRPAFCCVPVVCMMAVINGKREFIS